MSDKRLASGNIASATIQSVYTLAENTTARVYGIVLTNTTANAIDVDIYINDGSDRLIKSTTIPSGSGKSRAIYEITALSGGDVIKLDAGSADSFNYYISGREF